jgi:hypothetical protein
MMTEVSVRCYGDRPDPNAKVVTIGPVTIWFSYVTPIAFRVGGQPLVMRHNDWNVVTGRHMNAICADKKGRIPGDEFVRQLESKVAYYFFPRDLDKDCPAGIVADWLDDRGMHKAAKVVREEEA